MDPKNISRSIVLIAALALTPAAVPSDFTVVDTGQSHRYDDLGYEITCPAAGEPFYGQDANFGGTQPAYVDNGNGTVTNLNTGLMWSQVDSSVGMIWEDALAWVEQKNADSYLGYPDWRLPDAKELQSILDYARSPDTTASAAIDPVFDVTAIVNEGGVTDFPFYWTGTTHLEGTQAPMGGHACHVSFGRALGWMEMPPGSGTYTLMDVHGAGAQRSDPKFGNPDDYPYGHGPQGDVVRIFNFVRLVRSLTASEQPFFADDFERGDTSAWSETVP